MYVSELVPVLIFMAILAAVYVSEIFLLLGFISRKLSNKKSSLKLVTKKNVFLHSLALIGVLCFMHAYFVEPYWIEVKNIDIFTEKLENTEFRILHISDLHCDKKIRNENKIVDIINSQKPDIIVFTGDTLNTPDTLPVFKEVMKKLNASMGKYAVYGNHDAWYWNDLDLFGNTGFEVLDEEIFMLTKNDENIYVSGINPDNMHRYHDLLEEIPVEEYSIFLFHYPDLIEDLKELNVDLYLAGHTHGGQVALPFYGALITLSKHGKKYESGKYIVGNTT